MFTWSPRKKKAKLEEEKDMFKGPIVVDEPVEEEIKEPEFAVEIPKVKVNITPEAHKKMFEYVHAAIGEISGMGLLRQDSDDEFTIYDVFILKQEASAGYTALDPKAVAKKAFELYKEDKYKDLSVWWHSHNDFGTFWSATDTNTCDRLANNKVLVSIVVNKRQESRCRIDLYKPLRITIDDVIVSMPDTKVEASKEALKDIKELVTPSPWRVFERFEFVEDPYLYKGTRISRKAGYEHGYGYTSDYYSKDDYYKNKHDYSGVGFGYGHSKRKKEKRRVSEVTHVMVQAGDYKITGYSIKDDCYVDKERQSFPSDVSGYVVSRSKHAAVVVLSESSTIIRVPHNKLKEIRDEEKPSTIYSF